MKKNSQFKFNIMEKFYTIQGIIFQQGRIFGLGNKLGIGTAVKIQEAMIYAMFHAVIGPSEEGESFCGHMSDRWGNSAITNFKISDEELSFTKHYEDRPPINYLYGKKDGNVWFGGYAGINCGRGISKCVVLPINEYFFDPNFITVS